MAYQNDNTLAQIFVPIPVPGYSRWDILPDWENFGIILQSINKIL